MCTLLAPPASAASAGKRYCMNAAALRFVPEGEPLPAESRPVGATNNEVAAEAKDARVSETRRDRKGFMVGLRQVGKRRG